MQLTNSIITLEKVIGSINYIFIGSPMLLNTNVSALESTGLCDLALVYELIDVKANLGTCSRLKAIQGESDIRGEEI
jgi:hypothetical protein